MKNRIITSDGNIQLINVDGVIFNVSPLNLYTIFERGTVSFMLTTSSRTSGKSLLTSTAEDLTLDGQSYTFEQLPNAISEAFSKAGAALRYEVVDELPTTGRSNTIYLVEKEEEGKYYEYIYIEATGEWDEIGDTDIQIDNYLLKADFFTYTAATQSTLNTISGNVDTISGQVNTISGNVDTLSGEVATKASQTDLNTVSGNVDTLEETVDGLETEISGKASQSDLNIVSGNVNTISGAVNTISGAVDTLSGSLDTRDEVIAAAFNDIDKRIDLKADLSGLTAVSNNVDTLSGQVATKASQSDLTSVSGRVTTLETAIGNLKFVKLTQAEYDALVTKDNNTVYIIV